MSIATDSHLKPAGLVTTVPSFSAYAVCMKSSCRFEIASSPGSPLGPALPVRYGAAVGRTRISTDAVPGGISWANCGIRNESSSGVRGWPENSVMVLFSRPHSVMAPIIWLNAEALIARPRP